MRLLPDTNVLICETIEDSEHHLEACELIDNVKEIFIPSIVIHEYIWVTLRLGIEMKIVFAKVKEYLENPKVYYFSEPLDVYIKAANMLLEDKKKHREINDYIILATAIKEKTVLATYDKELRKAASKRGIKTIP